MDDLLEKAAELPEPEDEGDGERSDVACGSGQDSMAASDATREAGNTTSDHDEDERCDDGEEKEDAYAKSSGGEETQREELDGPGGEGDAVEVARSGRGGSQRSEVDAYSGDAEAEESADAGEASLVPPVCKPALSPTPVSRKRQLVVERTGIVFQPEE